jgi:dGTPase
MEEFEAQQLAPYAQHSRASRGRAYAEAEHAYRTAFQRDRDRILHTTAFRRLEYKTQVFVNYEGDHYRTRLTHTLEVAQIARTLARALQLNQDLVECIALAHDMGHTPFGHTGEATLHELMADKGGFNHNTQGLRIVEKLEQRYPAFPGLNLTWEVREGIIKHATEYDTPEATEYEPDWRATLEGQIINVADEVAYNTHDLDDGLRSGLIEPHQLRGLALWDESLRGLGIAPEQPLAPLERGRVVRVLIDQEVTDVLHATALRLQEAQPASVDEVRHHPNDLVVFSEALHAKNRELKRFLMKNLYRHWRVVRMAEKAKRLLVALFEAYNSAPQQLPAAVQERISGDNRERIICDYIAGMTDRFALQEHQKMFDPNERV